MAVPFKLGDSWAIANLRTPESTTEISLEQENPTSIIETEGSLDVRWDFLRERTLHTWKIWLSSPQRRGRRRTPSMLQAEVLPTRELQSLMQAIHSHECMIRLDVLLRLAKADLFWIDAWSRRSLLRSKFSPEIRVYSLDRDTQKLVQQLNQKLCDFFWDQWLLRAFSVSEEQMAQMPTRDSREEWARILSRKKSTIASTHYIGTSLTYYLKALGEGATEVEHVVVQASIALEALISDEDEKGEIQFKLARRVASMVGEDVLAQKRLFELLRRFYDLRSKVVHGSTKAEALSRELKSELPQLLNSARLCILSFLALRETPKKDILNALDYGTFDLNELGQIKSKVQAFYGKEMWPRLVRPS